ncbi:hypothetical protein [Bradyrhizobium ivorense]|uniref:hypothetical protein n=1 Tax=Bradyrhizobium ivorense TaxID=2511166 RepID=UPI00111731F2|nr:hypothetical protein [Bradyrhizobium ivorense]
MSACFTNSAVIARLDRAIQYAAASRLTARPLEYWVPAFGDVWKELRRHPRHPEVAASSAALEGSTATSRADSSFEARKSSHLRMTGLNDISYILTRGDDERDV